MVGHKFYEFVEEPTADEVEAGLGALPRKAPLGGTGASAVEKQCPALYFDCVLNAIVKGDEVVGVSMLARDVTEEREKERRFTELFETLQEGVYFSTPEGQLLDANAALVQHAGVWQ